MTDTSEPTAQTPSNWSVWGEATELQRAHFKTLAHHRAWSRLCNGCGQGDFLERKQKPTSEDRVLQGRGFPVLPEPALHEGARSIRFRTPWGREHVCMTPAAWATRRR